MTRLIDADALLELFPDEMDGLQTYNAEVQAIINSQPTIDAEPVRHGKWTKHEYAEESEGLLIPNYECSECHMWERKESDYCPNCGADMRGEG